jgi:hypothetical protein
MSDNDKNFVMVDDDGENKIDEDAQIFPDTLKNIKFVFGEIKEIGDKYRNNAPVSDIKRGRTAYAGAVVKYTDGSQTNNACFGDVIFHYSSAIDAANGSYGRKFISIGIHKECINKVINDANKQLGVKVVLKNGTEEKSGYYWLSCNLEKLLDSKTFTFLGDNVSNHNLYSLLKEAQCSFIGTAMFTIGITQTTSDSSVAPDLKDGTYNLTMKPTEAWLKGDTDIEGPIIVNRAKANESIQPTANMEATGKLAALLRQRLKI